MAKSKYQIVPWPHIDNEPKEVLRSKYYITDTRAITETKFMEGWVDDMGQYSIQIFKLQEKSSYFLD